MQAMLEAAVAGARDPALSEVTVVVTPALAASVPDVLAADGFLLGTPANIGYMSGALKHFFDQVYYPCLQARPGAPYGLYVHGDNDTTGAVRAVTSLPTGPVTATGLATSAQPSAPAMDVTARTAPVVSLSPCTYRPYGAPGRASRHG